jgi:CheY-like chemotaxis protein
VHLILKDDYKIRIATSGAGCWVRRKRKPLPYLIPLDVMMPDMFSQQNFAIV